MFYLKAEVIPIFSKIENGRLNGIISAKLCRNEVRLILKAILLSTKTCTNRFALFEILVRT